MTDALITIGDVRAAAKAFEGRIDNTPFLQSQTLSELTGAETWLKFENLQFTRRFNQRGALNKLLSPSPDESACGVVAMSAGNRAQGVAYHADSSAFPQRL